MEKVETKSVFFEAIQNGSLGIIGESIANWTSCSASKLREKVDSSVISREQLRDEMHKFICYFVRKMHGNGCYRGIHAIVLCASPFALAYALKHEALTDKETEFMEFGAVGGNVCDRKTFIKAFYKEGFRDKLVAQLLGE